MTLHKFGYSEDEDKTDKKKILQLNMRIEDLKYQLDKNGENLQSQLDNNILKVSNKLNAKIMKEKENIDKNINKLLSDTSDKLIRLFSELNSTVKNNILKTVTDLNGDVETKFNDKIKDLNHIIERIRNEKDEKIGKDLVALKANQSLFKQHVLKLIDALEGNVTKNAKNQMEINKEFGEKIENLTPKVERFENFETKTHNTMEIMDLRLHQVEASIIFIKDHLHIK